MLYLSLPNRFASSRLQRRLEAAGGYLELGMTDEAMREIEPLSELDLENPALLRMRIRISLFAGDLRTAECEASRCLAIFPEEHEFMVQRIFALNHLDDRQGARKVLRQVPRWLHDTGLIHYNLACYEARIGDLETARECARSAFSLNALLRRRAARDPDLSALPATFPVRRVSFRASFHFFN